MLFADLLSLHLVTFLMFLILATNFDAITMATCMLIEGKDSLPIKYPINTL